MSGANDGVSESLEQDYEETRQTATGSSQIADEREGPADVDRRWIAQSIITIFVVALLAVLTIDLVEGLTTANWATVAQQSADLIRTDLLPVVTLILGYYFGRSGRA